MGRPAHGRKWYRQDQDTLDSRKRTFLIPRSRHSPRSIPPGPSVDVVFEPDRLRYLYPRLTPTKFKTLSCAWPPNFTLKLMRSGLVAVRAGYILASVTVSRRLPFASRSFNSLAASGVPLRLRPMGLATQLNVRSVSPTRGNGARASPLDQPLDRHWLSPSLGSVKLALGDRP
jgi:hypothetical protein